MAHVVLEKVYKTFPQRSAAAPAPVEANEIAVPPEALIPGSMTGQATAPLKSEGALDPEAPSSTATSAPSVGISEPRVSPPLAPLPSERLCSPPSSADIAPGRATTVLRDINLTVHDGEFLVLVGPSGCGKSTLLRIIAGLEPLTGGNIWVGDRLINGLPPKQRDIAMVFQNYALYPHLTVYDNLAFGLRRMGRQTSDPKGSGSNNPPLQQQLLQWSTSALTRITRALPRRWRYWSDHERAVDRRVREVAHILQIESLLDRLPRQLSGGQKQRVALGRAMARNPQAFLMDEPLSNLDAKLRTETRAQIVNLQRQLKATTIYVTHDQTEAMTMGDRIVVLNGGKIQQVATPMELYSRPANRFVAEFIGTLPMNFMTVEVKAPCLVVHSAFRLTLPETWIVPLRRYDGRSLILGIRPEHLSSSVPAPKNIPVRVERIETLGSDTHLTARISHESFPLDHPTHLQVRVSPDQPTFIDEKLWLSLDPHKVHLFDPQTEEAILPTRLEPHSA